MDLNAISKHQLRLPMLESLVWLMVFNATFNNILVLSWRSGTVKIKKIIHFCSFNKPWQCRRADVYQCILFVFCLKGRCIPMYIVCFLFEGQMYTNVYCLFSVWRADVYQFILFVFCLKGRCIPIYIVCFLFEMKYFLFNVVAQFMEFDLDNSGDIGKFCVYIWLVCHDMRWMWYLYMNYTDKTKETWTCELLIVILHQSYLCTCTSKSPKLHQMETVPFANLRIYDSSTNKKWHTATRVNKITWLGDLQTSFVKKPLKWFQM
jgi:hypothetical protein